MQAPTDLEQAFAAMRRERVDGLLVLNHPMFYLNGKLLAELAVKHRLPMLAPYRPIAEAGGLIGYEPDFQQVWRRAATFVDRILQGTKVGELPIDQSARSCIFVNLKTAKALDLTIPQAVLRQADEVIQ